MVRFFGKFFGGGRPPGEGGSPGRRELGSGKVSVFDLPSEQKVPILEAALRAADEQYKLREAGDPSADEYEALKKRERDEETDRRYTRI